MNAKAFWTVVIAGGVLGSHLGWAAGAPGLRFGFIDLPQLVYKSDMGKDYLQRYKKEVEKRKGDLKPVAENIQLRISRLQEQRPLMSQVALKGAEEDLQRSMKEFEDQKEKAMMQLGETEEKLMKDVMAVIYDVVAKVAKAEQYDYVFEKRSLLHGGEELTQKIMIAMNDQFKKGRKK